MHCVGVYHLVRFSLLISELFGHLFYSFLTIHLMNRFVYLILEDGTDRLSRNVDKELPLYSA